VTTIGAHERHHRSGSTPLRTSLRVLAVIMLVVVVGAVGFRALYTSAERRCFATPPNASVAEYPAREAEGMNVEVDADGFTCAYTMRNGDNGRIRLGWLP
jgi:hypothetical protein